MHGSTHSFFAVLSSTQPSTHIVYCLLKLISNVYILTHYYYDNTRVTHKGDLRPHVQIFTDLRIYIRIPGYKAYR
jgi:hypothetical protein